MAKLPKTLWLLLDTAYKVHAREFEGHDFLEYKLISKSNIIYLCEGINEVILEN